MNRAPVRFGALPLAAAYRLDGVEALRQLIVLGCAVSLILAGRALPF